MDYNIQDKKKVWFIFILLTSLSATIMLGSSVGFKVQHFRKKGKHK